MAGIYIIDTSVLLNILNVPGRIQVAIWSLEKQLASYDRKP